MRFKIYTTLVGSTGTQFEVRLMCTTDSQKVKDLAVTEAVSGIGESLVVIVLENGEVIAVVKGGHGKP